MKLFITHPLIKSRKIADFGIVSIIMPLILSSTFFGYILAVSVPKSVPIALLALYTFFPLYKTTKTAWRRLKREIAENRDKKKALKLQQEAKNRDPAKPSSQNGSKPNSRPPSRKMSAELKSLEYDFDAPQEPLIKRVYNDLINSIKVVGEVQSNQFEPPSSERSIKNNDNPEVANSKGADLINPKDIELSPEKEEVAFEMGDERPLELIRDDSKVPALSPSKSPKDAPLTVEFVKNNMRQNKDHYLKYLFKNWAILCPLLGLYMVDLLLRGSKTRASIVDIGLYFIFWVSFNFLP